MTLASPLIHRQPPRAGARAVRVDAVPQVIAPLFMPAEAAEDDEFRMNLGDLPRMSPGLHVDGFTPSLTSRILDLFDRIRGR